MTLAPIVVRLDLRRAWIMERLDLIEAEAAGNALEPGPQIAREMLRAESEFLGDLTRTLQLMRIAESLELTGTPQNL